MARIWTVIAGALIGALLSSEAFAQAAGAYPPFPNGLTTGNCIKALNAFQAQTAGGPCATTNSPTFTGTVTFPDGATWASTGVADAATYTTASTPTLTWSPNWAFSSTANGISALTFSGTMTPTGASAGNVNWLNVGPTIGTYANNINIFRGLALSINTAAGFTGTMATGFALNVQGGTISGSNPITALDLVEVGAITNGNGATSGTVTNNQIDINASSAAAGGGGTLTNTGIKIALASGSSAGTTNRGLYITNAGGAASVNYAIYSDSTAPSALAGPLITSGAIPTIASGACGTTTNGTVVTGSRTNAGEIDIGAAATTTCTVVFAVALATAPVCVLSPQNAAAAATGTTVARIAATVNGFVITGSALANANYVYNCL